MRETFGKELGNFIKKTLKTRDYKIQAIKMDGDFHQIEIDLKIIIMTNK